MRMAVSSTKHHALLLAAVILSLLSTITYASSSIRNPLRNIHTLRNATIHTHTGRASALSHFDLSFILDTDDQVKLSLEPNHDIFPEAGIFMTVVDKDGRTVSQQPIDRLHHRVFKGDAWVRRAGEQEWDRAGWARINLLQDGQRPLFDGIFSADHITHHIQPASSYSQTRHPLDPAVLSASHGGMILYRDVDVLSDQEHFGDYSLKRSVELQGVTCMTDDLRYNSMSENPVHQDILRRSQSMFGVVSFGSLFPKRQNQVDSSTGGNSAGVNLVSTIGQTAGCPTTRKVALVGVATDCTYRAAFDSLNSTQQNVIAQMSQASAIYERTFQISLGLANLTVMDPECPATAPASTPWNRACSADFDISARLNSFSGWRGNLKDNNSHWTLLSTCNTGSAVGLAWLGQACVGGSQSSNGSVTGNGATNATTEETVAGANVVIRTQGATEWQVIAHETGHTFGAVHDCTSQTCSDGSTVSSQQCCPLSSNTCDAGQKYMMNPSTSNAITDFSPCSIGNICSALGRNSVRSTCLSDNKGVSTFTGQQCGNGIVEPGEDCDCGGTAGCGNNTCCDATTCKFKGGAICDDANEDCCSQCQYKSAGSVCRASTGVCDPQETCSGTSPTCPADVTAPDGQSCASGLQCASGQCTSRSEQCKTVMGSYTSDNDTYACDSFSCTLKCASPSFGPGVCFRLQQNFLDGTPCSGSGKCANGICKNATAAGTIRSWIQDNKNLVIGLAVGIGLFLIIAFSSCVCACVRRSKRRRMVASGPPPPSSSRNAWRPPGNGISHQQMTMSGGAGPGVPPPMYPGYGASTRSTRYA